MEAKYCAFRGDYARQIGTFPKSIGVKIEKIETMIPSIGPNEIIFHQPIDFPEIMGPIARNQKATEIGGNRSCFRSLK